MLIEKDFGLFTNIVKTPYVKLKIQNYQNQYVSKLKQINFIFNCKL